MSDHSFQEPSPPKAKAKKPAARPTKSKPLVSSHARCKNLVDHSLRKSAMRMKKRQKRSCR